MVLYFIFLVSGWKNRERLLTGGVRIFFIWFKLHSSHEMLIVLPKQNDGLPALLTKLLDTASLPTFKKLFNESTYGKHRFMFHMPKFTLGGDSIDLKDHLRVLGMNEVFTTQADFSGVTGKKNLFIDSVMHQAVIEVSGAMVTISLWSRLHCFYFTRVDINN